jgi:hypothetical protein
VGGLALAEIALFIEQACAAGDLEKATVLIALLEERFAALKDATGLSASPMT